MTCIDGAAAEPVPRRNERRRSSCVRRDPDDILRSLRAVKGELGRTLSLSGSTARRKYGISSTLILLLVKVWSEDERFVFLPIKLLTIAVTTI